MRTPVLAAAALAISGEIIGAADMCTGAASGVSKGTMVQTAHSTASIAFSDGSRLELRLAESTLHVQGHMSAAGALALTVNRKAVPLPDSAVALSIDVGSTGPVSAVVAQGASSIATLTFARTDGHVTVSTSVSGSSVSVTTSTSSTTRR
jgi:hypothetical protein